MSAGIARAMADIKETRSLMSKARETIIKIDRVTRDMHGGWAMVEMMRPDVGVMRDELTATMTRLREIDRDCPREPHKYERAA